LTIILVSHQSDDLIVDMVDEVPDADICSGVRGSSVGVNKR